MSRDHITTINGEFSFPQQIHKNLMFCKQIVDNLIILDNKGRKQGDDKKVITREYQQLLAQLESTLFLNSCMRND